MLRRFQRSQDPDGRVWEKNAESTIKKKKSSKAGTDTGRLRTSMKGRSTKRTAVVGTNVIYAPTMQFGAKKGEFGKTKRGTPIPWGNIPARRFLGFSKEQKRIYEKWITEFISK